MPERTYFDLRYAVPGYTFIILFLGINYVPLLKILSDVGIQPIFGAFLALASLLGGSAIGWIVSQFWWWYFHFKGAECWTEPMATKTLIKKYRLIDKKDDRKKVVVVGDYITHSAFQDNKRLFLYLERRWDLYHLLSSEYFTLIIGFILGIICRVLFQIYKILSKFYPTFQNIQFFSIEEFWFLLIIFIIVFVLLLLLHIERKWVIFQHDATWLAIINDSKVKRSKLGLIFRPDYFEFGISEKIAIKLEDAGISTVSHLADANAEELSQKTGEKVQKISNWIDKAKEFMKE